MTSTCAALVWATRDLCGNPAPERHGMCEHEHLREGPICDACVAGGPTCGECRYHPVSPHRCPVVIAEGPA